MMGPKRGGKPENTHDKSKREIQMRGKTPKIQMMTKKGKLIRRPLQSSKGVCVCECVCENVPVRPSGLSWETWNGTAACLRTSFLVFFFRSFFRFFSLLYFSPNLRRGMKVDKRNRPVFRVCFHGSQACPSGSAQITFGRLLLVSFGSA